MSDDTLEERSLGPGRPPAMAISEMAYRLALGTVRSLSPVLALGSSKLARGVRGRRGAVGRLEEWARDHRHRSEPLVWFHAPSVGEGLQARATLEALRESRPEVRFAFTHFSPSAEGLARSMPAEVADYLPWDLETDMNRALDALRPSLVVFTKTEVWPVLTRLARERGLGLALVGATLPAGAGRLREPGRSFLESTFARLDFVGAVSDEDAANFPLLGVEPGALWVTGDPGIDSAAARAGRADPDAPYLRPFRDPQRPTLVAGSTWPPDEQVLLPAVERVRESHPELRVVVAPHEPGRTRVAALVTRLTGMGLSTRTLAEVESSGGGGADAVVVDRVGVLAHLYTVASFAFVGGGFHSDGLHSVLEPAAAGLPSIFGPGHQNAVAAGHLLERGGARVVEDPGALADTLGLWLRDPPVRERAGRAAAAYIEEHRGAAQRTAEHLAKLL